MVTSGPEDQGILQGDRQVRVTTPVHVFIFTEYLTLGAMVTLYHQKGEYNRGYGACKVTTLDTVSPGGELQPLPSTWYILLLLVGGCILAGAGSSLPFIHDNTTGPLGPSLPCTPISLPMILYIYLPILSCIIDSLILLRFLYNYTVPSIPVHRHLVTPVPCTPSLIDVYIHVGTR